MCCTSDLGAAVDDIIHIPPVYKRSGINILSTSLNSCK